MTKKGKTSQPTSLQPRLRISYTLATTNGALPLNQWLPDATNVLNSSGDFAIILTNAVIENAPSQQFFILKTQ